MKALISLAFFICSIFGCTRPSSSQTPQATYKATSDTSKPTALTKDSLIALLPFMKADSLNIEADVYWKIIKRGKSSIPLLIESLTDTTPTNIYNNCKHGKLNVGEVAWFALDEIADFPASAVTQIQFDVWDGDCWIFYNYLFDNRHKQNLQAKARDFYGRTKYKFVSLIKRN